MLGVDYHHTVLHEGGVGIRDQWTVNPRLHLDYGLREDITNYDFDVNRATSARNYATALY